METTKQGRTWKKSKFFIYSVWCGALLAEIHEQHWQYCYR